MRTPKIPTRKNCLSQFMTLNKEEISCPYCHRSNDSDQTRCIYCMKLLDKTPAMKIIMIIIAISVSMAFLGWIL